jgi:hypothetical protein
MGGFIGSDLFTFGGFNGSFVSAANRAYVLNTVTDTLTDVDRLPNAEGITHMGTVIIGNKVYGCGGFLNGLGPNFKATAECHVYTHGNPPGSQWSRLPDLPAIRAGGTLMHSITRNSLLFATGADSKTYSRPVDSYDFWELALDDIEAGWTSRANIPFRSNHVGGVTVNYQGTEFQYVTGGQDGPRESDGNYAWLYEYNGITDTWRQLTNMTVATGHISASTVPYKNCGFFIMGGCNNVKIKTSAIYYYDIGSDTWTKIGDLPDALNSPVCDILNDEIHCIIRRRTFRRKIVSSP